MNAPSHKPILRHATCVALDSRAVLILGGSGCGKSQLALQLIGLGAELVADDQVWLMRCGDKLRARAPEAISGRIEARGIGLLNLTAAAHADIVLAVDMERSQEARLPQAQRFCITDVCIPLIAGATRPNLAFEVMACLRSGTEPLIHDPDEMPDDGATD